MRKHRSGAPKEGDVIDARSFSELMVDTYRKNLEVRQRKERAKKAAL